MPERVLLGLLLLFGFDPGARHPRRIQLVCPVPAEGIGLERLDHPRERIAQRMLRLPAEQAPGARDVELVMVVRDVDHPRPDERILILDLVLDPRARSRSEEHTSELQSLMRISYA